MGSPTCETNPPRRSSIPGSWKPFKIPEGRRDASPRAELEGAGRVGLEGWGGHCASGVTGSGGHTAWLSFTSCSVIIQGPEGTDSSAVVSLAWGKGGCILGVGVGGSYSLLISLRSPSKLSLIANHPRSRQQ